MKECGKYILARRREKTYKIFLKDLKSIKIRARKEKPSVPYFEYKTQKLDLVEK